MLYLGHFSFVRDRKGGASGEDYHGYFTTVVEADDVESALDKFESLLHTLRREGDLFNDVNEVFLDTCVECRAIPPEGFLAHFKQWIGAEFGSIATAIRGATEEQAAAYDLGPDAEPDDQDGVHVEPFVTF